MHANEMRSKLMTPAKRQFKIILDRMLEVSDNQTWLIYIGKLYPETEEMLLQNGYKIEKKVDRVFTAYTINW